MKLNTFWKIVLKSIGLWLLINCVWVIPQFMSTLNFINGEVDWNNLILIWLICFVTLIAYILATRLFLYKTDWLVKILQLDKNFAEDSIHLQLDPKSILSITVTLIGGVYFMKSFPSLANSIFEFARQKELLRDYLDLGWMIYFFCSSVIGFLVMTNGKNISNHLWKEGKN